MSRATRDVERLAAFVALDDRDHLGREFSLVHQRADAQRALQAERDIRLMSASLFARAACRGRAVELLAVECVLPRAEEAVLGRTHRAQEAERIVARLQTRMIAARYGNDLAGDE
jgi:hypothetical protein